MKTPDTPTNWEERFAASFNRTHGQMHHLGKKKERSECPTCIREKELNPKGYSKTFLTEGKHYWNDELYQAVKAFIAFEKSLSERQGRENARKELMTSGWSMAVTNTQGDELDEVLAKADRDGIDFPRTQEVEGEELPDKL